MSTAAQCDRVFEGTSKCSIKLWTTTFLLRHAGRSLIKYRRITIESSVWLVCLKYLEGKILQIIMMKIKSGPNTIMCKMLFVNGYRDLWMNTFEKLLLLVFLVEVARVGSESHVIPWFRETFDTHKHTPNRQSQYQELKRIPDYNYPWAILAKIALKCAVYYRLKFIPSLK